MKNIGGRAVVHDDNLVQVPPQPTEVLDVVPPVEHARLPEQSGAEHAPLVQQVRHWVRVLKQHKFIVPKTNINLTKNKISYTGSAYCHMQ